MIIIEQRNLKNEDFLDRVVNKCIELKPMSWEEINKSMKKKDTV